VAGPQRLLEEVEVGGGRGGEGGAVAGEVGEEVGALPGGLPARLVEGGGEAAAVAQFLGGEGAGVEGEG
jgi:hypothetical protein